MPLHAQDEELDSSSWVDQVPDFRQEICQSHYRKDPVKYDLNLDGIQPSLLNFQICILLCCFSQLYAPFRFHKCMHLKYY